MGAEDIAYLCIRGKYVVIIVFSKAICQLSYFRYLLDLHSFCLVDGMHFVLCAYVHGKYKQARDKEVNKACGSGSTPEAIFHRNTLRSNSPPSLSPSLPFSISFLSWFELPPQIQFAFLIYLHFSKTRSFFEYTNIAQSVYVLCVCKIPNIL